MLNRQIEISSETWELVKELFGVYRLEVGVKLTLSEIVSVAIKKLADDKGVTCKCNEWVNASHDNAK
jgi:hypothetical protein